MNDYQTRNHQEKYGLQRMDNKEIELNPDDLLCFLVVKNESIRLPFILEYHRRQGISKFLIVLIGESTLS